MKIKCEYCGGYISDTDERCPYCQATNDHLKRIGNGVPRTIDELKSWYIEHNLPPEDITRFFIGKNVGYSRVFGIYFDENTGNYVVYKNKGTGERAIRYEGKDEAYAVNELYLRLKEEIVNQKSHNIDNNNNNNSSSSSNISDIGSTPRKKKSIVGRIILFIVVIMYSFIAALGFGFFDLKAGYYLYDDTPYYLYKDCRKMLVQCEIYEYDVSNASWSLLNGKTNIKRKNYVGLDWNNKNNIEIKKSYTDEDWYLSLHPPEIYNGYYNYDNDTYYYKNHSWYKYSNGSWEKSTVPNVDIYRNEDNYYNDYSTRNDTYNFDSYYEYTYPNTSSNDSSSSNSSSSNDDSWDSSSSWDSSDSWDSGSTDWDSDW